MRRWVSALLAAACAAVVHAQQPPAAPARTIAAPSGVSFYGVAPQFALSPDGRQLAYVAAAGFNPPHIWLQTVAGGRARALAGTEQASYPFWSADGASVGFFAAGKLKRIAIAGGVPEVVCDAPTGRGGTWNREGVILFTSGISDPLRRVAAHGGPISMATTLDPPRENSHRWPQFLPDGRHFVYWAGGGSAPPILKLGALDSPVTTTVTIADTNGAYGNGHFYFGRSGALFAVPVDAATFMAAGDPVRIAGPLSADPGSSFASVAASSGTLLYSIGDTRGFRLTWFTRSGARDPRGGQPNQYTNVALSPDGRCGAFSLTSGTPPTRDIWIAPPLGVGPRTNGRPGACVTVPLTSDAFVDATPVWSPDGARVLFSSQRGGRYQMFVKSVSAPTGEELVLPTDTATIATDWCRDGHVLYTRGTAATGLDVWMLSMIGDRAPRAVTGGAGAKDNGVCSPDSAWIAYQSNESGRDEIYVRAAAGSRPPLRVSTMGGAQPLWRADGKELFYLGGDGGVMSAGVRATPTDIGVDRPVKLFAAPQSLVIRRSYDVTADGQRFLIPILDDTHPATITVVVK